VDDQYANKKKKFINFLTKKNIETRPIISGNFINQPATKLFKLNSKREKFPNADKIEKNGFFIGLKTEKITQIKLKYLVENLLKISEI